MAHSVVFDPNKHAQPLPPPPLPGSITISGGPWTQGVDIHNPPACTPVTQDGSTPVMAPNDGGLHWSTPTVTGHVRWICGFAAGGFTLSAEEASGNAISFWRYTGSTTDPTGTYLPDSACNLPATLNVVLNP
jgi:hypothetical protein